MTTVYNTIPMKNNLTGKYTAPEIRVMTIGTEHCIAASGGTENSGSTPGKFDGMNFDWSDFSNFKF